MFEYWPRAGHSSVAISWHILLQELFWRPSPHSNFTSRTGIAHDHHTAQSPSGHPCCKLCPAGQGRMLACRSALHIPPDSMDSPLHSCLLCAPSAVLNFLETQFDPNKKVMTQWFQWTKNTSVSESNSTGQQPLAGKPKTEQDESSELEV